MLNETGIRWTDVTWNPVHGCSKTSEGCKNCYAAALSYERRGWTDKPWTIQNAAENVSTKPERLQGANSPAALPEDGRWVFVNSMSDLLHEQVSPAFVGDVLGVCAEQPSSAFQILSKHGPDDGRDMLPCPKNVMLGVSVESSLRTYRLDWLRKQPAQTKFVSFEPLVEPIRNPDLSGIDWAIIGGETGDAEARREMDPAWARDLVDVCREQDVAPFFKQHSGARPEGDVELALTDGGEPRRIEEFPELPEGVVPAPQEFIENTEGSDQQ